MLGKEETVSPIERGLFIRPSQLLPEWGTGLSVSDLQFLKKDI